MMTHSHRHGQDGAGPGHSHGPAAPHPAQTATPSILRMALLARLATALAVSAGLWAAILVAMR